MFYFLQRDFIFSTTPFHFYFLYQLFFTVLYYFFAQAPFPTFFSLRQLSLSSAAAAELDKTSIYFIITTPTLPKTAVANK